MALRLRRGTDAERLTITPEAGEPLYTTDTKQLYVGDGTTSGGILVGPITAIADIVEDVTPQLGGNLDLNGNNIIGSGNINITGTITATGNINLGDGVEDNVIVGGEIGSNLTPTSDAAFNLGSVSKRWGNVYAHSVVVDGQLDAENINANLIADDSVVAFDSATGQFKGLLDGDLVGSVFADDSTKIIDGQTGEIFGNLTGNLTGIVNGTLDGEMIGSVFADNSTKIIDGQTGEIFGNLTGSLTGNVIGDVVGSVFADDSTLIIDGINRSLSGLTVKTRFIESDFEELSYTSTTGNSSFSVTSDDDAGLLVLRKNSSSDLSGSTAAYGRIIFARNDINGSSFHSLIAGSDTALSFGVDDTGTFSDLSKFVTWTGTNFGIGTLNPASALDVNGNGNFSGNVEAAAFKGSVVSDDSTIMIDAVENTITAGGFIQFGSLTSSERDDLTATNGMVIYNTTNNKFEGYQNGAWINLDDGTAAS